MVSAGVSDKTAAFESNSMPCESSSWAPTKHQSDPGYNTLGLSQSLKDRPGYLLVFADALADL